MRAIDPAYILRELLSAARRERERGSTHAYVSPMYWLVFGLLGIWSGTLLHKVGIFPGLGKTGKREIFSLKTGKNREKPGILVLSIAVLVFNILRDECYI